jgi:predicted metalloprotease with PDZ domain
MSRMAPFVDAARAVDRTNFNTTFISYYTYGGAIALGLDLTLRERSDGKVTLDDFMRAMWRTYGAPGGPAPGLVAHPYSVADVRDRLAEVSGDRAFATDFVNRYIVGREALDYARLLARAGIEWRQRDRGHAWLGDLRLDAQMKIATLVPPGSPAYEAGLEQDDVITGANGKEVASPQALQAILGAAKPGDQLQIAFTRRDGPRTATVVLKEDPTVDVVPLESPSPAQKAFRHNWLGSKRHSSNAD